MFPEYYVSYEGQNFIFSPTEDTPGYRHSTISEIKIGRCVEKYFDSITPGFAGLSIDTTNYATRSMYIIGLRVYPILLDSNKGQTSPFTCHFIAKEMTNKQSKQTIICTGDRDDNNLVSYFNYNYSVDKFEPVFDFKQGNMYQLYLNIIGDNIIYNLEKVRVTLYLNGSCGHSEAGSGTMNDNQDEPEQTKCAPCIII